MTTGASAFVVTCEHGGNEIPQPFNTLFNSKHARSLLRSHRGYDPGAWEASIQFADGLTGGAKHALMRASKPTESGYFQLQCPNLTWIASRTTRLLVDLNRLSQNPDVISSWARMLPASEQGDLLSHWHTPYRDAVEAEVTRRIELHGSVVHLSIHTFTPRIQGRWRPLDVGLLFDPSRVSETVFCETWRADLLQFQKRIRVRLNQPYAGTDDGLTTVLRTCFDGSLYLGIEIEICNRFFKRGIEFQARIVDAMLETLLANPRFNTWRSVEH